MFTSHQTNDKYANLKLCKSLYILTSSNPICRNIYQQIERYIYSENTLTSEFQNNATFLMGSETIKFILRVLTDFLCVIYCGAFVILIYICHGSFFFLSLLHVPLTLICREKLLPKGVRSRNLLELHLGQYHGGRRLSPVAPPGNDILTTG